MTLLSICIPSYNRAHCLPDLLHSIAAEYDNRVEVVICDNGSTDNTEQVVSGWLTKYGWIRYEKIEKNVGPDRCFLRSVEISRGMFCWLMGDDDILEKGGLQIVLSSLKENPDLTGITLNRAAYDKKLEKRWLEKTPGRNQDKIYKEVRECFTDLFTLFGFLSAQVVKRDGWLSVVKTEDVTAYYNAYVLIYIIGRMIQKNPYWLYVHIPCVGWRSGNDSFAQELGRYRRFALDVVGYDTIVRNLCLNDRFLCKTVMRSICLTHFLGHVRDLKFHPQGKRHIFQGIKLCLPRLYKYSHFWIRLLPCLLVPRWVVKSLRYAKYSIKIKDFIIFLFIKLKCSS